MLFGDLLAPNGGTRFPVGNVENIGEPGREALAETLGDLVEEPVGKDCDEMPYEIPPTVIELIRCALL